jgi:hypothetical protein
MTNYNSYGNDLYNEDQLWETTEYLQSSGEYSTDSYEYMQDLLTDSLKNLYD